MKPEKLDAAEGRWLTNKMVVVIIIAIVGFTSTILGGYYSLRAEDAKIQAEHNTFKEVINTKLDSILDKIKDDCHRD